MMEDVVFYPYLDLSLILRYNRTNVLMLAKGRDYCDSSTPVPVY